MKSFIQSILFSYGLVMSSFAQTSQDPSSGAVRNIYDMLRTIPGVEVSINTGISSQQQVYIRDSRNLKGKVAATFVVDRVVYDGDVGLINPMDVAEITVLKDDAAAAAYGARAFGGVILISTKNGKGTVPAQVTSYNKSAYQYFITKELEIRVIGKDGKTLSTGTITKETDSSIYLRKKEILKKEIEKVEIVTM
jgi:hypothetical protein